MNILVIACGVAGEIHLCEIRRGAETGELFGRVDFERAPVVFSENRYLVIAERFCEDVENSVSEDESAFDPYG